MGHRACLDALKKKSHVPCLGYESRFLGREARSAVTILTALSQIGECCLETQKNIRSLIGSRAEL